MATTTINGVAYAYDRAGHGNPLLLLHAGITDRRMWDDAVPLLTAQHSVLRVDLRGFGETPLPDGPFVWTDDVAALLATLGIARTHVCGVSLGAGIALDLALAHPDLVDRLVLVAPGLSTWDWDAGMREFDDAESVLLDADDLDAAAWLNVRFWVDGSARSAEQVDARVRQRVFEMQRRAFEIDNPDADGAWLVPDRHERLGDLAAPTLILVGELDHTDFAAIGRHMATEIPDARVAMLPGVAHLPPMEAAEPFAEALLMHLN